MRASGCFYAFLACAFVVFQSGCQTDYRVRAVEKARKYALENTRGLTEVQRDFLRYTDPEIMESAIFRSQSPYMPEMDTVKGRLDMETRASRENDFMHTCVVWNPPEMSGASVVVDGAGERSMRSWTPNRLIVKYFNCTSDNLTESIRKAIAFVSDSMPEITTADFNNVRFRNPEIRLTSFSLKDTLPEKTVEKKESGTERFLWDSYLSGGVKKKAEKHQISMIWNAADKNIRIVAVGLSPKKDLVGWTPVKVLFRTAGEVKKVDLGTLPGPLAPVLGKAKKASN